jgi:hypothetical protein
MCGHQVITKKQDQQTKVSKSSRINLLSKAFRFFGNAFKVTEAAEQYAESRKLEIKSGAKHHID